LLKSKKQPRLLSSQHQNPLDGTKNSVSGTKKQKTEPDTEFSASKKQKMGPDTQYPTPKNNL
jgi:hypothetical protein